MISGDYSAIGLLIGDNKTVKTQLDLLSEQIASGHVADSYGGLGAAAQTSLNLRPQLNSLTAQDAAINSVAGRLSVTQSALSQIAAIASSFAAQTDSLNGVDASAVDTVAASAKVALQQLAGLLDTTDGSTYVFAGTDSSNPPIPDPDQDHQFGVVHADQCGGQRPVEHE
jgi:flagellar hook-associated protein 3 FlgL